MNLRLAQYLLATVSVVNPAGGSFCCNYATDLFIYGNYASDNVYCISAGSQVLLSVTGMLMDLSVTIMQVTKQSIMQLEVSAAHIQVVFSAMHYPHGCVYCNYAGDFPL